MKKILVPIDFSKTSIIALDTAFDIAKKASSDITLLHIIEEPGNDSFSVQGQISTDDWEDKLYMFKLLEKAKKQLEKVVLDPKYKDVTINSELRVGNAFHGIRTIITEQKVDLVVMGTKGTNSVSEMIIGTNTERVVRHSKVPVLTVQKKPAKAHYKNIVYATAMAGDEEVFSKIVKRAQQIYNSTIHLVRINTPSDFQQDHGVRESMQKFAKSLQLKNYTINIYNDFSTEEGIVRFADSIDADMIAMATHGRTGFAHVIAGSVAEEVVNQSKKRPVLTFVVGR
jgi:nucleotide-binding universal stress UspA family protein